MGNRHTAENLILLCKTCHSEIDQQPQKYTEAHLLNMRAEHYRWVERCLGTNQVTKPPFHYLSYINIPRVDMYAAIQSIALPQFSYGSAKSIRELGFNAGRLMAQYTSVMNQEELYSNVLHKDTEVSKLQVGEYWFSPEAVFRTKGIDDCDNVLESWENFESVVYRQFKTWRLICLIDPRWITTSTAFANFRSGSVRMTGLLHINKVDARLAVASPLFLGAADRGFLK